MTIHLVTTSDLQSSRTTELARLLQTVEENANFSPEPINLVLLLQNCSPSKLAEFKTPSFCKLMAISDRCSLSAARNRVLRAMEAQSLIHEQDIVGFPDDDCWFTAQFIARLSEVFRQRPHLKVFFCRSSLRPDEGIFTAEDLRTATIPQIVRLSSSNNVFYRGSVVRCVGLFDPELGLGTEVGGSEDTDFVIRCTLSAGAASFIDRELIGHAEPSRASAVKYFRSSLVVLMRYADRRPRLMLEFVRKICVGLVFATRGNFSFKFLLRSLLVASHKKSIAADRIV